MYNLDPSNAKKLAASFGARLGDKKWVPEWFAENRLRGLIARDFAGTNRVARIVVGKDEFQKLSFDDKLTVRSLALRAYGLEGEAAARLVKNASIANMFSRGLTALGAGGGGFLGYKASSRLIKGKSGEIAESGFKRFAQRAGIVLGTAVGAVTGGAVVREISLNTIMATVFRRTLK